MRKLMQIAALGMVFFSCQKEVDIDLVAEDDVLVIEALVTEGDLIFARVDRTYFLTKKAMNEVEMLTFLSEVDLKLTDNKTGISYQPDSVSVGYFWFPLVLERNKTYTLEAKHKDFPTAKVVSDEVPDYLDFYVKNLNLKVIQETGYIDSSYYPTVVVNDPEGYNGVSLLFNALFDLEYYSNGTQYYGIENQPYSINSSTFNYMPVGTYFGSFDIYKDEVSGGLMEFEFYMPHVVINDQGSGNKTVQRYHDKSFVGLRTTERTMKYIISVSNSGMNDFNLFTEPEVLQNAAEGGIGVFGVFSKKEIQL